MFVVLPATHTHVDFVNKVESTPEMNIFNYRNFYNGGGVAIGDINGDNLPDLYLTANTGRNHLYLNKGNFVFEDVTAKAGVGGSQAWSTGVTMADVNSDGRLDIYVCNAGDVNGDNRRNELFINKGLSGDSIPVFQEQATNFGLDDQGYSTHATFFDYDRDGDLDVYLLNNSSYPVSSLGFTNLREKRDELGGDKLLRNDGSRFTDVSEQAGIYGSLIGFGLGITIGDVDNDNWPDIFISNDFYERDYLYLNNHNGTFTETSKAWMQHESLSSMGADIADIDNDGNQDIFVTDMLPADDSRLKRTTIFENYDLQQFKLARDFHQQYMQNMLHLNNGDNTFSEVARLAGVAATDWSWGALLFDMDNDGLKDIFVANGIYQDLTDQDFVNFLGAEETMRKAVERGGGYNYNKELISKMTSTPIPNYAFQNTGNLQFVNKAKDWGLGKPGFSNGAAYGDMDNDGDLDLVVNNENMPVSIYKNRTSEKEQNHFLRVQLQGAGKNRNGIGAKVYVHQPAKTIYLQQMPNRGFQSSVDLTLVFGLGKEKVIDSVTVVWPDDKMQTLQQVKPDQQLTLKYSQANKVYSAPKHKAPGLFFDATQQVKLNYTHQESDFVDYNRDVLLKQMFSTQGPALAVGDVNGDGLEDVYAGGVAGSVRKLFLQQKDGTFAETSPQAFAQDQDSEEVAAILVDLDKDKDLDLFVVTGSNEFESNAPQLLDRLYLNDGKGHFTKDNRLPNLATDGSCVAAADFDLDGDVDLFVGSRMVPGSYGYDPPSYLFQNDGTGNFKNYTKRFLPRNELGMVTDAAWVDLNGDRYPELVLVGDWMPVTIYTNNKGRDLQQKTEIAHSAGWWNSVKAADLDSDGDPDLILGNLGRNTRLTASVQKPVELYVHDFEGNGTVEQIINCYAEDGKAYPMVLKQDLQKRVPSIKKKFVKYASYAGKQMQDIFPAQELKEAVVKRVENANSSLLLNKGNLQFALQPMPLEAQFSPIYGIETLDYNHDGNLDILLAGNFFDVLPELGQYDASYGLVLQGTGKGQFRARKPKDTGFFTQGQVRRMQQLKGADGMPYFLLAKNNATLQVFGCRE